MKHHIRTIMAVLVIFALLVPRLAELTRFTAADEPFWLVVGANYYYALTHGELDNTVYEYHPAVTTMWIGFAAMVAYFPEYRAIANGYIHQEKTLFDTFMLEHGKQPLVMLWWARFFQVLLNTALFVVSFFLLRKLLDEWLALGVLLITSFTPYLFGQSRMLNHETMVGLFSLIAILALAAHLYHGRNLWLLILSASSAALANLTKSSAIVLMPVVVVMIFIWALPQLKKNTSAAAWNMLKVFLAWLGFLLLAYFIIWPGMWVAPGKMLYEVYGNAFSYAFQGARLSVTHELEPSQFSLASAGQGFWMLITSMAWRTTPITWIGLILAGIFAFQRNQEVTPRAAKYIFAFLLLESLACIGMFSLVQGRDQPHYVMAAYYGVEFTSAIAWMLALRWLMRKYESLGKPAMQLTVFAALLIAQAYPLFYTAPYYYTYLNPILLSVADAPRFNYGERMEEAAAYLAAKPGAEEMTAFVYFGRSFSYYFPGRTILFAPIHFADKQQLKENLKKSDYLVIYTGQEERLPLLKQLTPEHIIDLNGRPYVAIYNTADIPQSFYK